MQNDKTGLLWEDVILIVFQTPIQAKMLGGKVVSVEEYDTKTYDFKLITLLAPWG